MTINGENLPKMDKLFLHTKNKELENKILKNDTIWYNLNENSNFSVENDKLILKWTWEMRGRWRK